MPAFSWGCGPGQRSAQSDNRPTGRSKVGRGFHPKKTKALVR